MFAPSDPNINSFNNFKNFWRTAAVSSGQVAPAYFPFFDNFTNQVAMPAAGITESDFNIKISDLAAKIKAYFTAAQYRGNLTKLIGQIEDAKPKYTDIAVLTDPKYLQFITFRNTWKNAAVKSGQVPAKYFPFYDVIVNPVATPTAGLSPAAFSAKMDELVAAIKRFYQASEFRGNLAILNNSIDNSRPDRVTATPTATPTRTTAASQGVSQEVTINSQKFFKNVGGIRPAVDYTTIFENLRALTDSDKIDIEGLINGTAPGTSLRTLESKLDSEIVILEEKVQSKQAKIDALNQQFVDERGITGKVSKPKVMVLQDWILAGFTITYLFFAIVAVLYVSSKSALPGRAGAAMLSLMVVVSAVLYTYISYLA